MSGLSTLSADGHCPTRAPTARCLPGGGLLVTAGGIPTGCCFSSVLPSRCSILCHVCSLLPWMCRNTRLRKEAFFVVPDYPTEFTLKERCSRMPISEAPRRSKPQPRTSSIHMPRVKSDRGTLPVKKTNNPLTIKAGEHRVHHPGSLAPPSIIIFGTPVETGCGERLRKCGIYRSALHAGMP